MDQAKSYARGKFSRMPLPDLPRHLGASIPGIRDYQLTGIKFLTQRLKTIDRTPTRGFILADAVGLGKTIQAILASWEIISKIKVAQGGRVLVVCPATLKVNWEREIRKWVKSPGKIHIVGEGKGLDKRARWNIINYDVLMRHYEAIEQLNFHILLLDECHMIKGRDVLRSKLVVGGLVPLPKEQQARGKRAKRRIEGIASFAKRVFVLTGTPLTNRPKDLFNLLRAVNHPLGRNFLWFGNRFCGAKAVTKEYIRADGSKVVKKFGTNFDGKSDVAELRRLIDPIFLQRKKRDHLKELPPITREWLPVQVDTKAYKAVMDDFAERRARGELKDTISYLSALNEARLAVAVSKVKTTIEIAESLIEQGEKVLIGSQFTRVTDKLSEHFGDRAVVYTGEVSAKKKQQLVDQFQVDPAKQVFIGTYTNGQSAATGLTLTAASSVIVSDLDYVPANIIQFIGRADRMGQKRKVQVYLPVALDTFDMKLSELLEQKMDVINDFEHYDESLFKELLKYIEKSPTI